MAEYKPCSNPQCKEHHIRHPTCKKPGCSICSTKNGPILCDEMIVTTGEIIPLTQRERDIDSILRYFYTNCGQEVLDVHSLTHTVTEQFPCIIIVMYHFLRKCSEGWTYNIHDMSRKYPKEEIAVNLYQAALHFNITEPYKQFLKASNLQYFLPTDLEQVD